MESRSEGSDRPVKAACFRALESMLTWPWALSVQDVVCSAVQE